MDTMALAYYGLIVAAYGTGLFMGWFFTRNWWRWEMVERGYARYHYYDGKWYWLENLPKPHDPAARKVAANQGK